MATVETRPEVNEPADTQPGETPAVDQQWLRRNMWAAEHEAAIRQSGHDPAGVEAAYWTLYALCDEHFPDDDVTVAPLTDYRRREGASDDDVFRITIDTAACSFDVDARQSDLPAAFARALRTIADRNLAVADAIAGAQRPVNRSYCVALEAAGKIREVLAQGLTADEAESYVVEDDRLVILAQQPKSPPARVPPDNPEKQLTPDPQNTRHRDRFRVYLQ